VTLEHIHPHVEKTIVMMANNEQKEKLRFLETKAM